MILPFGIYEKNNVSGLAKLLKDNFVNLKIIKMQRKYFNEKKGLDMLKNLSKSNINVFAVELFSK